MTMTRLLLASLFARSIAAVAPAAPPDEARLQPVWQAMDRNGDGKAMLNEVDPL